MAKKIALIFGITGQDGSILADFLLKKGYKIIFEEQVLAVTPGQSAVIYRDNECLGGSIIRDRISENYYKWAENRGYNYEVYG